MTETTDYLGSHPKSYLQCWSNQLWIKPRVTDKPYLEAGKLSKLYYPVLAMFGSPFFWYMACPVWTPCILSVVKAWAVSCLKASFDKKKTSSKWSVRHTHKQTQTDRQRDTHRQTHRCTQRHTQIHTHAHTYSLSIQHTSFPV